MCSISQIGEHGHTARRAGRQALGTTFLLTLLGPADEVIE